MELEAVSMKYQKEISLLQSKLRESLDQLKLVEMSKRQIQDNMKQAFMRGLCAMNMEAMNTINPRQPSSLLGNGDMEKLADNMSKNITKIGNALDIQQNDMAMGNFQSDRQRQNTQPQQQQNYYSDRRDIDQGYGNKFTQQRQSNYDSMNRHANPVSAPSRGYISENQNISSRFLNTDINNDIIENPDKFSNEEVDQLFNNAMKNFNTDSRGVRNENGSVREESSGVVILRDPLPESKEHLWRQAPVVGAKPQSPEINYSSKKIIQPLIPQHEELPQVGDIEINSDYLPPSLRNYSSKPKDNKKRIRESAQNMIKTMAMIQETEYEEEESSFQVDTMRSSNEGKVLRFEPKGQRVKSNRGLGYDDAFEVKSERKNGLRKSKVVRSKIDTGLRAPKSRQRKAKRGDSSKKRIPKNWG